MSSCSVQGYYGYPILSRKETGIRQGTVFPGMVVLHVNVCVGHHWASRLIPVDVSCQVVWNGAHHFRFCGWNNSDLWSTIFWNCDIKSLIYDGNFLEWNAFCRKKLAWTVVDDAYISRYTSRYSRRTVSKWKRPCLLKPMNKLARSCWEL